MSTPKVAHEARFFPAPLGVLDYGVLAVDLYLKHDGQPGPPTLYRAAGLAFTPEDTQRLTEQNVSQLLISAAQHHIYRKGLVDRLDRIFADSTQSSAERARTIRAIAAGLVNDVLRFPGDAEPVAAIAEVARAIAVWPAKDPAAFSWLIDLGPRPFDTAAHMVNVGMGCALLAFELFPDDRELLALCVLGGMLHDIGKRTVPAALLGKEGRLTPEEWKVVSAHPTLGYDELRRNASIPQAVLGIVRDHHERLDGKGYPAGVDASRISPGARLCAVIDVFDAITSGRAYRAPTPPADAIQIMREGRATQFDSTMLDAWARAVDRILAADPSRAPEPTPGGPTVNLKSLLASCPITEEPVNADGTLYSDNRRRYTRHNVNITANARIVRAGKALPVRPGELFTVQVMDLGRGGVQIRTLWPLTQNDLLSLEFEVPGQRTTLTRLSRVVRVRKTSDGAWSAGMAFVEGEAQAA